MMTEANIGHNSVRLFDPELLDRERARVSEFADAAGAWLDLGEIASDEHAGKLKDFIDGARGVSKQIDAARTAAKKPHDDASKAVQAAFKPLLDALDTAVGRVKPMLTAYLVKKEETERAAREEAARIAREELERAARMLAEAQARNDVLGEAEAAAAAEAAQKAEVDAERAVKVKADSFTGGGRAAALRSQKVATLTNIRVAFLAVQDDPAVVEAVLAAIHRKIRAKEWDGREIPGVSIAIERIAA